MEKTIENVLEVFKDYIASSPFIDVCQTKFGYVLLHYSPERDEIMYTPELIPTGDEMLQTLREEIILDVIGETDHDLELVTKTKKLRQFQETPSSKEELEEIEKRLSPYLERLS